MSNQDPLVSAIVPAFNAQRYVREAIDSILGQTYANIEVLVVDNASTDDTAREIKSYGERVTYLREDKKGPSAARNRGLKHCRGEFIAFLDADDLWLPDKTERQLQFLAAHPEYGICYSHYEFIDADGKPLERPHRHRPLSGWVFEALLKLEVSVGTGTVMIRRECIEKVGDFEEQLMTAEDTNLYIRLAKYYQYGYLSGPVARYRVHPQGLTKTEGVRRGTFQSLDCLVDRYPELHPSGNAPMAQGYAIRHLGRAKRRFFGRDYREARHHALKSVRYRPLSLEAWYFLGLSCLPARLIDFVRTLRSPANKR